MTDAIIGNLGALIPAEGRHLSHDILALWSAGKDTLDIARALGVPEADIYNRLPKVLERARQDDDWAEVMTKRAAARSA